VTIKVGATATEFSVHKALICAASTYFRAAFEGPFREGTTQTIRLPETRTSVFKIFVGWLYTQKLELPLVDESNEAKTMISLTLIYALGDECGVEGLRNAAIDATHAFMLGTWKYLNHRGIDWIYDHTPRNCALRRLVVRFYLIVASSVAHIDMETFNHDFVSELAKTSLAFIAKGQRRVEDRYTYWRELDLCAFHDHAEGTTCSSNSATGETEIDE